MISLRLNGCPLSYDGPEDVSLLDFLRQERHLHAAKDGCSGQAACGACLVEVNGKGVLACVTPMSKVDGAVIVTLEGLPQDLRHLLAQAFVEQGAVQCGFCTPAFITRTRLLLAANPCPTREEVVKAVRPHLCRCTGYVKLVDGILAAAARMRGELESAADRGVSRYGGLERALGTQVFMDDMELDSLLHGALHFSEHPRAKVLRVDTRAAAALPGVRRVLTAADVPGQRHTGMHLQDWPIYVAEGEITRCIGDVLACAIADSPAQARAAAAAVRVEYAVLEPLTDMEEAQHSAVHITPQGNVLASVATRQGEDVDAQWAASAFKSEGYFETPVVEHAYLEVECSVAMPWDFAADTSSPGVRLYSMGQWIGFDRASVAAVLHIPQERVSVVMVDAGGGFGGKEDCSTQLHAALGAFLLHCPVKVKLSRPESLRMHAKRHATHIHYALGCDALGRLTALKARILADSGAYASTGAAVMLRMAGHANGAYHIPHQNIEACAVYTNNPPGGAFRGFGVCQVTFALETLMDDLCYLGGFDRWQFRRNNALTVGGLMPTGQRLTQGMSRLPQCLDSLKPAYDAAMSAGLAVGLACGIKNSGFGNGLKECCTCKIRVEKVEDTDTVIIDHGWSELGQGLHTVARELFLRETGLPPETPLLVRSCTDSEVLADATTASRASFQLGHALLRATAAFKKDWDAQKDSGLHALRGRLYEGAYSPKTEGPGKAGADPLSHEAYSFAAHLVVCRADGQIQKIVAAHDSGMPVDKLMYEGQVEGGVVMGLGYALSEELRLQDGRLVSEKVRDLGLLRAPDVPQVEVIIVRGEDGDDPRGPHGIKGLGEITCIPTAPAVTNALRAFDGQRITRLPVGRKA